MTLSLNSRMDEYIAKRKQELAGPQLATDQEEGEEIELNQLEEDQEEEIEDIEESSLSKRMDQYIQSRKKDIPLETDETVDELEKPFIEPKEKEGEGFLEGFRKPLKTLSDLADKVNYIPGQLAATGLQTAFGLPGDIAQLLQKMVPKNTLISLADQFGLGEGAKFLLETQEKYSPTQLLPTSGELKKFTKDLTGDMFEPKSEVEQSLNDAFSGFVAMAVGGAPGNVKLIRPLITALGAEGAKETVNYVTGSTKWGDYAKSGVYVTGAFIQPKEMTKFYNESYALAKKFLPEKDAISATPLQKALKSVEKEILKGGSSKSTKAAEESLETLKTGIKKGEINVDWLVNFRKKLNEETSSLYASVAKPGLESAKRNMELINNAVKNQLVQYGKTNPEWAKAYTEAQSAYGAVAESSKGMKRIVESLKGLSSTFFGVQMGMAAMNPESLVSTMGTLFAGGTLSYPVYQAIKTTYQLAKSPALRKAMFKLYRSSLKQSTGAIAKNANDVNEIVKKESQS